MNKMEDVSKRIRSTGDVLCFFSRSLGIVGAVIWEKPHIAEALFDALWNDPITARVAERLIDFFARAEVRRKARVGCPAEDPEEVAAEIARQEYRSTT